MSPRAASVAARAVVRRLVLPDQRRPHLASLAAYIATVDDDGVQIHQYAAAQIPTTLADGAAIGCEIDTRYPEEGRVAVRITEAPATPWTLSLRVPYWATGATLDGRPVAPGWPACAVGSLRATWWYSICPYGLASPRLTRASMRPRLCRRRTRTDRALRRVRGPSHGRRPERAAVLPNAEECGGAVVVTGRVVPPQRRLALRHDHRTGHIETLDMPLGPYHRWARRGPSTMRVWLPVADGTNE